MLLEARNLKSGYGRSLVLHGAELTVGGQEMVSIIGPNGAGKSTLVKTIMGIVPPREGTVIWKEEEDITGMQTNMAVEYGISYVPQTSNVFQNLTVEENLRLGAWNIEKEAFGTQAREQYELFPILDERRGQRAGNMSGGQQQMLAFASALMTDPDLLILDEPSAGLAPQLVSDIFNKIQEINEAGTAIVMVEQNARQALNISDRGIVLAAGENKMEGVAEEILGDEEIAELYLG